MTNTKFRKRALLSSVAMLLVALVALGSATFAWYAATLTVKADGMNFSTTAGSGLLIASDSGKLNGTTLQWATSADMDRETDSISPASFNQTSKKYFTATGTDALDGTYDAKAVTEVTALGLTDTTYVLTDYLYFKQSAGSGVETGKNDVILTKVDIDKASGSNAAATMASAIRVVVTNSTGTVLGEFAPTAANDAKYFDAAAATNATVKSDKTLTAFGSYGLTNGIDTGIDAGTGSTPSDYVIVRVYLDGFDANTISDNAQAVASATDILNSVKLEFTMD